MPGKKRRSLGLRVYDPGETVFRVSPWLHRVLLLKAVSGDGRSSWLPSVNETRSSGRVGAENGGYHDDVLLHVLIDSYTCSILKSFVDIG